MGEPTVIRKIVTFGILVPLAIVIVMFAVANRQTVVVSFDPFGSVDPAYAARMPLFVLIFVLVMLGVLLGGVAAWLRQSKWRRAARLLNRDVRALREENEALRRHAASAASVASAPLPPPARLHPPAA
jgi:uncharacterized integral membrane protein